MADRSKWLDDEPGRPAPRPRAWGMPVLLMTLGLVIGSMIVAAGFVGMALLRKPVEAVTPETAAVRQPASGEQEISVGTGQLVQDYRANHLAADAKYKEPFTLTAKVHLVTRGMKGEPLVVAATHLYWNPEPSVYLHFASGQESGLADVKKGDAITVRVPSVGRTNDGIDRSHSGKLYLTEYDFRLDATGCRLLGRAAPEKKPPATRPRPPLSPQPAMPEPAKKKPAAD